AEGDRFVVLKLRSGEEVRREGVLVALGQPFETKSAIGAELGCEKTELGFYKITDLAKTSVPGVFAAGDVMTMMHSVLYSAAQGQVAGAFAAGELSHEDFMGHQ
ncbi:MAG: NAD(P)/FAD-dependent oxidoreductase, partial [Sphingobacteriales bacterium]